MSKVTENESSDDDALYSINSDLSDIDSDDIEEDNISGELKLSNNFESKIPQNSPPIAFFLLYYTPELVSDIVDQLNLFRIQTKKHNKHL
ncbi:unnamed protein product [Rotaria sp. Silwood2]|nr:unnamed protein product [Rotaria sp. Silwood2]CAF3466918.1 unnamed protein product [Rotaria sp. Silwood2]CAF4512073.1 unnamed protein product [Rotaria sp. Silwood2]CAF4782466.1 unnamed protein product [Rotaria sp. Silwood2]